MLTDRVTLAGHQGTEPEDFLASSLAVIFPDDITNQHGDTDQIVVYASPAHGDIRLTLAEPRDALNVRLFSHFVWNAGLQLAALIEEGADWKPLRQHAYGDPASHAQQSACFGDAGMWDVRGKRVLEIGAGTGIAGILAARSGAAETVITDYPAAEVISNLDANVARNCHGKRTDDGIEVVCYVRGHEWGIVGDAMHEEGMSETPEEDNGRLSGDSNECADEREHDAPGLDECQRQKQDRQFTQDKQQGFDRVLVADCLWMPWQHENIMKSIRWFLADDGEAWIVAGFHTGRAKMAGFFDEEVLGVHGLVIKHIWERDAGDHERSWVVDRGVEDVTARKRWLVIAVLGRKS